MTVQSLKLCNKRTFQPWDWHKIDREMMVNLSLLQFSTIQWGPLIFHRTQKGSPRSKLARPNGNLWGLWRADAQERDPLSSGKTAFKSTIPHLILPKVWNITNRLTKNKCKFQVRMVKFTIFSNIKQFSLLYSQKNCVFRYRRSKVALFFCVGQSNPNFTMYVIFLEIYMSCVF